MTIAALDNYKRTMAPAFVDLEKIPVFTLFQHLFTTGQTIIEPVAEDIDIDIQRGNKKIAVYIPRGTDATNTGNLENRASLERYTSDSKVFPLIEEITNITSTMVKKRMPGENPYSRMSPAEKQSALAAKAHIAHMERIIRRQELSASESFRTGLQTIDGGFQYDFYRRASHSFGASVVWSDSANAKPLTDLNTAGTLIFQNGNRRPTDGIFGETAWLEFLETTQVKETADNRRINHFRSDMDQGAPAGYESWVAAGAVFQGTVKTGDWSMNLWTYPAIYETDAGTKTRLMPATDVVVFSKEARMDRYFGPADILEVDDSFFRRKFGITGIDGVPMNVMASGIFSSDMFHLDAYGGVNNKSFTVRTQTAPIYPTIETDCIATLTT